ncbi:hypothetical protein [Rhizobium leguminosarum]|uniref:Uncharacterized protein n=1 Tax=Rhizobium leguminosarum TaxID=384 RepID=A0A7X0A112_RHILE|nr:hypothetical protein [Rhizobium leguminosarum]MBB6225292.1 hypothetical protein [Rhizobium leguminosarum]
MIRRHLNRSGLVLIFCIGVAATSAYAQTPAECDFSQVIELQNLAIAYFRQASAAEVAGDVEQSCDAAQGYLSAMEQQYDFMQACGSPAQIVQVETLLSQSKRSKEKFCEN